MFNTSASHTSQNDIPLNTLFKNQLTNSECMIVTNLNTNHRPVSPFYTFKLSEHEFTFSEFSDVQQHVTKFFFDREQWQYDGKEMDESLIQMNLAKIQKVYRDIHNQKVTILENRKENISEIITTNHEDKEKVDHTIEQIIRGNIHIHSLSAQELEKIAGGAGLSVNDLSLLIQRTIGERPQSNIVQLLSDKKVIDAHGQHRIYKATKQQQLFLIKWLSTFIGKYSIRKTLKKEGAEKAFEKALQYGGVQIRQTETQTKIGSLIKLKGEDIFIGGRKVDPKQLMQKIDVYYTGIENAYFELSDQDQLTQNGQAVFIHGNLLDGTIKDVNNRTIATIKNGVLLEIDNPKLLEGLIYILLTQHPKTIKDIQTLLKTDNREFLCAYNRVLQLAFEDRVFTDAQDHLKPEFYHTDMQGSLEPQVVEYNHLYDQLRGIEDQIQQVVDSTPDEQARQIPQLLDRLSQLDQARHHSFLKSILVEHDLAFEKGQVFQFDDQGNLVQDPFSILNLDQKEWEKLAAQQDATGIDALVDFHHNQIVEREGYESKAVRNAHCFLKSIRDGLRMIELFNLIQIHGKDYLEHITPSDTEMLGAVGLEPKSPLHLEYQQAVAKIGIEIDSLKTQLQRIIEPLDPPVDLVGINEADSISKVSEHSQLAVEALSKLDLDHFQPEMTEVIENLLEKAKTLFNDLESPKDRKLLFQGIQQQLKRIDHAFDRATIAKSFETLIKAYSNSIDSDKFDHSGVYSPSGKKQKALYNLTQQNAIQFENFADLQKQLLEIIDPHHLSTVRLAKSILLNVLKSHQKEVTPHFSSKQFQIRLFKEMGDIISNADWKPIKRYVPIIHTNDQGEQTFLIQKSTILPANAHFQKSLDSHNSILEDHTFLDYEETGVSCLAQDTAHRAVNLAKTVYQDESGNTLYSGFRSGVMDAYLITTDYWLSLSDDEKLETAQSFLDSTYRLEAELFPEEFRDLLNQYLDQAEPLSKKELHTLIDYMRSAANFIRAEETLKAAALNKLLDPDYLSPLEREGAIQNAEFAIRFSHPDLEETSQQPIPLHFLSTALVTPDIWRKGLHGERKMLQNQIRALEAFHGKTISISIKDASGQPKEVHFKVDIYAFNFGVNEGALGQSSPLGWAAHSWEASDHYNTLAFSRLEARVKTYLSDHPATDNRHIIEKLFQQIQDIWKQKDYRYQESDPYKMPKRLLYLAFLMGDMGHFNCKSGKDRTGMLDVEVKHFAQEIQMLKLDHPGSTDWELPPYKAGGRLNTRSLLSEEGSYQLTQLALLGGNLRMHEYNTHLRGYKLKGSPLAALKNRLGSKETWNDVLGLSQFAKS